MASEDALFLEEMAAALERAGLEAIVVGMMAAILSGAPSTTRDVDLLIRDTTRNREKLTRFSRILGGTHVELSPLTRTRQIVGTRVPIDVLFDEIAGGLEFAELRSRGIRIEAGGGRSLLVASLEDVIKSKEAAGRPKDLAQLPVLRDTLKVKQVALDVLIK